MKKEYSEFIKSRIAPCGLHCGNCFAFVDGDIHMHSSKLKEALGDFDSYAERFVKQLDNPVFLKYPEFKEFLNYLSASGCNGCRKEQCKFYHNCRVHICSAKKHLDYCFQCDLFPCKDTGLDENLYKRHVAINKRMQEIGIGMYYEEIKALPRYRK